MLLLHLLKTPYLGRGLIGLLLISLVACGSNDTSIITFPENRPEPLVDVLPETLALTGQAGEEVSERLELKNERAQSINFSASSTKDWLSVTPAAGTLASNASVVLTLSAECPDEPAGFSSIFSLNTGGDNPKELAVTLQCEGGSATEGTNGDDTGTDGTTDGSENTDGSDGETTGGSATDGSDGGEEATDGSDGDEDASTDGSDETDGADGSDGTTDADDEDGEGATDGADTGSEDGAETDGTTGTDGAETDGDDATTDGSEDADGSGDTGADGDETTDGADGGGTEDTGSEDTGADGDSDTDGSDTGEPTPQAELANLSPTELSLSAVAEESVPATISFSNTGDAPLEYALLQTSKETWLSFPGSAGSLPPGESATLDLTATCPAQAQTLSSFLDLETNDPDSPMTPIAVELVCAAPPAQDVTLSISAEGSSFGRVTSTPAGINCLGGEGTCSADFISGTPIYLTAQAEQANAQFMGWLSGPCAGQLNATCEVVLEEDLNVAVNFTETSSSAYDISFHFVDASFSATQRAAFESAAQRWMQATTTDLRDITEAEAEDPAGCGSGATYRGDIDDLVISVAGVQIDGPDGVLAEAGPCWLRPDNGLPYFGVLNIDLADVSDLETSGKLEELVLHEMGHVLGIGTLWDSLGLLGHDTENCDTATEVVYTGGSAYDEFLIYGGSGLLSVEEEGGRGTKCYHFDEQQFQSELMTGFLNFSGANPMSRLTIGGLQDIGYQANLAAADTYTLPDPASIGTLGLSQGAEVSERLLLPKNPLNR